MNSEKLLTSATQKTPRPSALRVVLVETETPGNLGATARALKSMGLSELRLVRPHRPESAEAITRAVSARDVLLQARQFPDLESALSDCGLVFATSGKVSSLELPRYTPRVAARHLWDAERELDAITPPPALVFGRESKGLTRAELARCHAHVMIPTHPSCPSLNLASAVQIVAYEHWLTRLSSQDESPQNEPPQDESPEMRSPLASTEQREHFIEVFEQLAVQVGALNPERPRNMIELTRTLLGRALPRRAELSVVQSVVGRALNALRRDDSSS